MPTTTDDWHMHLPHACAELCLLHMLCNLHGTHVELGNRAGFCTHTCPHYSCYNSNNAVTEYGHWLICVSGWLQTFKKAVIKNATCILFFHASRVICQGVLFVFCVVMCMSSTCIWNSFLSLHGKCAWKCGKGSMPHCYCATVNTWSQSPLRCSGWIRRLLLGNASLSGKP